MRHFLPDPLKFDRRRDKFQIQGSDFPLPVRLFGFSASSFFAK
jgi:hypothetical protein